MSGVWVDQLDDWRARSGPLPARLSGALRELIEAGGLPVGTSLPAERQLAAELSISRGTVVAALSQLAGDGLIERRQGSGSRVVFEMTTPAGRRRPAGESRLAAFTGGLDAGVIDMTNAAPNGSDVITPGIWEATHRDLDRVVRGSGYLPFRGLPTLRDAISEHMRGWGLDADVALIAVTSGAQQGVALCAQALVTPGDRVIVERQTWPGAIDVFREAGARLVPIASDDQGPDITELRDAVSVAGTALVYLSPSAKNPTGLTMPSIRRARVVETCHRHGVPIIDDCVSQDVTIEEAPPALASFDPNAQIVTVGSTSKLFWGGIRVGWVHTSEHLLRRMVECKRVADLGTSLPSQVLATHLLRSAAEVRERRVADIAERCALVRELVGQFLPGWRFVEPSGGFALWMELPMGDGQEFTQYARREGVAILPGSLVSADESGIGHIRLAIIHDPATTRVAFQRLGAAWSAYRRVARPVRVTAEQGVI